MYTACKEEDFTVLEPNSSAEEPWRIPGVTSLTGRFCLSEFDLDTMALLKDWSLTGIGTGTDSALRWREPRGGWTVWSQLLYYFCLKHSIIKNTITAKYSHNTVRCIKTAKRLIKFELM